jgi:lipoate-protein ligase A
VDIGIGQPGPRGLEAVPRARQLTMPSWPIHHVAGDVAAFHARELPIDQRRATFCRADTSTLVLGSSQRHESVDTEAASRQGIDVVRRRSGGGGVLLWPGEFVWLDLEIPADDDLWSDDVGRSMWWVGELWCAALAEFEPLATVHRGRLQRTRWSTDVCFAGTGPGEVVVGDAKLVGISQRRTRQAARFQTMVHLRWRPDVVASLVAGSAAAEELTAEELAPLVKTCTASAAIITERLIAALHRL